jgi:hypothetical protein
MKKFFLFLIFIFFFNFVNSQSRTVWTFGPMFHFYFGKKFDFSVGLEAAVWKASEEVGWKHPYSIDFGVESLNGGKVWIYSEFQTGVLLAGISIGPCLEIRKDSVQTIHFGMQGSVWANFIVGTDARLRWVDDNVTFSPGAYLKIPFGYKSES